MSNIKEDIQLNKIKIVNETSKNFLIQLQESCQSTYDRLSKNLDREQDEVCKDINKNIFGYNLQTEILKVFATLAKKNGLKVSSQKNKAKNYTVPIITTDSYIIGCIVDQTDRWKNSSYMKNLTRHNQCLNQVNYDFFEEVPEIKIEKLFIYLKIDLNSGILFFNLCIPYDQDLVKSFAQFSIDDALTAFDENSSEVRKSPSRNVRLKKKKSIQKIQNC